ncbi:MAG TPA: tyrosine-type recombinase/integrase [Steroidobacteraceae bacterium]|jgi:integrase
MKAHSHFQSFLGSDIEQFLTHKRSLGRRYEVEAKTLVLLDRYLLERGVGALPEITPVLLDQFLLSRPRTRPRSYNHLRCTLGQLFSYLVAQEKLARNPLRSPPRRCRYQRTPFIFDMADAERLLALAKTLPKSGQTYYVLFAVLYGLGLRVGEACRLCVKDVDLTRRLLVIRQTKFYKTRLVPFGPKLQALLLEHLRHRQAESPAGPSADQPVFTFRGGRPINPGTPSQMFHHLVPRLHLTIPPGVSPPRLHDLRHSFAVGALTRWYRLGLDPQTRLLALATFMGHVDVNSTAIYLTTTPTLLDQANQRFEAFAAAALSGGPTS